MKNFALIGTAGYIAPRHLRAIKETGNTLLAALDPFDSVGILDSYFPDAVFFTESERFDRHLAKLYRAGTGSVDYVSICSPNYLHDAHIRMALRNGANAICEKPIVLNPWNIVALKEIEAESGRKVYTILQLRHHPSIIALKKKVDEEIANSKISATTGKVYDINLTYITSRGAWYHRSWKGSSEKSGGIATNIGVHFFDMLTWVFGSVKQNVVFEHKSDHAAGFLQLQNARVNWLLSINRDHLPSYVREKGKSTFRSLTIEGQEIEFSDGFADLHTVSYLNILQGKGFGLDDALESIQIVHNIRNMQPLEGKRNDSESLIT